MSAQLELTATEPDFATLTRIRVETALSRFPIHRLAKKGTIAIDIRNDGNQADFKWEVTYNVKHGQPGPLAYKVDTLVVNRKIDEAERPLPKIIRLGSLHEIGQHLGLGGDTNLVKKALHQNASAYVEFSIRYKRRDGTEKALEQGDNRYGVVFTGEKLPGGQVADAVYLILHDWYRELLDDVTFRPLDYDYLRELPAGAQRFYELLSFQVFGALASGRPRAKLLYSDYCTHAPQMRYDDWERVRKQMYKVHAPHLASGYISKVAYEETAKNAGNPDWEMLYTPGPKASIEYGVFTTRKRGRFVDTLAPAPRRQPRFFSTQSELPLDDNTCLTELTRRGVTEKKARELLAELTPGQEVMDQIEWTDSIIAKAPAGKFHNPPGLYVATIRDNVAPPAPFLSSRKRRLQEEAHQAKNAELAQYAQQELAYAEYQSQAIETYIAELPRTEYAQTLLEARRQLKRSHATMSEAQLEELAANWVRAEVKNGGRVRVMGFAEFCGAQKAGLRMKINHAGTGRIIPQSEHLSPFSMWICQAKPQDCSAV